MSKMYGKRPSEILGIIEEYDAYCLDEAVAYIILKMEQGEQPKYKQEKKADGSKTGRAKRKATCSSFSEMYGGETRVQRRQ
jgi:hypothetical protein